MSRLAFTVLGVAQSAGSKRALPAGGRPGARPIVVDDNPKSKGWQRTVAGEAAQAMSEQGVSLMHEPLLLRLRFVSARPGGHFTSKGALSAEGRRRPYPAKRPDLTKLIRGVEDALTHVVWRDDALIVQQEAVKVYGDTDRVEIEVEPARPSRPYEGEPEQRLVRLEGATGELSVEVDPAEHVGSVLTTLEPQGPCACGEALDPFARWCAGCGRATFSPYAAILAKRAAGVPLEPEQGNLQIARSA